jgi:hypothetical protein
METTCQTGATIHHRIWHVDPYLSNTHLRELVGVLPDPRRLEGKATGERIETCLERGNVDGQHDEPPPFIMRWCTIL